MTTSLIKNKWFTFGAEQDCFEKVYGDGRNVLIEMTEETISIGSGDVCWVEFSFEEFKEIAAKIASEEAGWLGRQH